MKLNNMVLPRNIRILIPPCALPSVSHDLTMCYGQYQCTPDHDHLADDPSSTIDQISK